MKEDTEMGALMECIREEIERRVIASFEPPRQKEYRHYHGNLELMQWRPVDDQGCEFRGVDPYGATYQLYMWYTDSDPSNDRDYSGYYWENWAGEIVPLTEHEDTMAFWAAEGESYWNWGENFGHFWKV